MKLSITIIPLASFLAATALASPLPTSTIAERDADASALEIDVVLRPGSERGLLALPSIPRFDDILPGTGVLNEALPLLLDLGGNGEPEIVQVMPSASASVPGAGECLHYRSGRR